MLTFDTQNTKLTIEQYASLAISAKLTTIKTQISNTDETEVFC